MDLLNQLSAFLITAKRATYAGKGEESTPSRPNSHDLQYRDGDLLYIDSYVGGEHFSGEEVVFLNDVPIWAMNYSGRTLSEDFSGDFLKAALSNPPKTAPYRGPQSYIEGDFHYINHVTGDFTWFQGNEQIFYKNTLVYECHYHGGDVK